MHDEVAGWTTGAGTPEHGALLPGARTPAYGASPTTVTAGYVTASYAPLLFSTHRRFSRNGIRLKITTSAWTPHVIGTLRRTSCAHHC